MITTKLASGAWDVDPEVEAQRARMRLEHEAKCAAMRAAEREVYAAPIMAGVAAVEAAVADAKIPGLMRALQGLSSTHAAKVWAILETNVARRQGEARRLQEAEAVAAALRGQTARQRELASGSL